MKHGFGMDNVTVKEKVLLSQFMRWVFYGYPRFSPQVNIIATPPSVTTRDLLLVVIHVACLSMVVKQIKSNGTWMKVCL